MIHGYHGIFGAYGFWLPNDPRGSWSDFVGKWELVRYGRATKAIDRKTLTEVEKQKRELAKRALKYPAVHLTGEQARAVGNGFANSVEKSGFTIWACSIMPDHVHLVIARHGFNVEQIVNLLKGDATRQLSREGLHPLAKYARPGERPPTPWAERKWKVFLDSEDAIDEAIRYVENNPVEEGLPRQKWTFVTPFQGLDTGWVTYY